MTHIAERVSCVEKYRLSLPDMEMGHYFRPLWVLGLNLILTLTFVGFISTANAAIKRGFNPLGNISDVLIQSGANNTTGIDGATPDNFAISTSSNLTTTIALANLDGYRGVLLRTGVLLVFYDGEISGSSYTAGVNRLATGTWSTTGQFSVAPTAYTLSGWGASSFAGNSAVRLYNTQGNGLATNINVKYGIYVSATADITSAVTIPAIYLKKYVAGIPLPYVNYKTIITNQTVKFPTNCSISVPPTVSFNEVANSDPIKVEQTMSLQCDDQADVFYTVTPKSGAGTHTTIPMNNNASGNKVADIRGFLWNEGLTDAGCQDKASSMVMDNTAQELKKGLGKNESQMIPVSWVLCPAANNEPGPAAAALSFDITW